MTTIVADTHAIVWHLTEPRRVGRAASRALGAADAGRWICYVPAICLVEMWLLHERGRLRIGPAQVLQALAEQPGYSVLPLCIEQALVFGSLASVPDPMDRLIVSAATATRSRLLSRDAELDGHGLERVWD
jgi:PIN domain nuclease of toxin-antitoxin system